MENKINDNMKEDLIEHSIGLTGSLGSLSPDTIEMLRESYKMLSYQHKEK